MPSLGRYYRACIALDTFFGVGSEEDTLPEVPLDVVGGDEGESGVSYIMEEHALPEYELRGMHVVERYRWTSGGIDGRG